MFPEEGKEPPLVAWTCRPLIVKVSALAVPVTEKVTVAALVETEIMGEAEISFPVAAETVPVDALKFHPAGAESIKVILVPVAKSPLALLGSLITILPKVVNAGDTLFAALSAEMLVPPVAVVIVTAGGVGAAKAKFGTTKNPAVNNISAPAISLSLKAEIRPKLLAIILF